MTETIQVCVCGHPEVDHISADSPIAGGECLHREVWDGVKVWCACDGFLLWRSRADD